MCIFYILGFVVRKYFARVQHGAWCYCVFIWLGGLINELENCPLANATEVMSCDFDFDFH